MTIEILDIKEINKIFNRLWRQRAKIPSDQGFNDEILAGMTEFMNEINKKNRLKNQKELNSWFI